MMDFLALQDYTDTTKRPLVHPFRSPGKENPMSSLLRDKGRFFVLLAVMLIAASAAITPITAMAGTQNNHADTRYSRFINKYAETVVTPARKKTDATSMYSNNDRSTGDYYAMGVGSTSPSSSSYSMSTVIDNRRCVKGYAYKIRQNVFEYGYKYARLRLTPQFSSGTLSMLWSPDSV